MSNLFLKTSINRKWPFIFLNFLLSISLIAQNEDELVTLEYTYSGGNSLSSDEYPALSTIKLDDRIFNLKLNFGHHLSNQSWALFYGLNYQQFNPQYKIPKSNLDSSFLLLPNDYYQLPSFSQLATTVGFTKQVSPKWRINGVLSLNISDDFFRKNLVANLSWGSLLFFEKQQTDYLTLGAGVFLNQLQSKLFYSPIVMLNLQNKKRGLELLIPERIRMWQRINQHSFLVLEGSFNSHSLNFQTQNFINTVDLFAFNGGINYNYLWADFLRLSIGIEFPFKYYIIDTNMFNFNYTQQNGLSFKIGLSIVIPKSLRQQDESRIKQESLTSQLSN